MSRTILIVEDNPEERKIFATYLEFVGGRLLEAANGAQGLRIAREERPDLILMDLTMPVMDGWNAVRCLHSDSETASIPVLAITGRHLPAEQLTEAGFCGYLEKPISPFRVLKEVERCLGPFHENSGPGGANRGKQHGALWNGWRDSRPDRARRREEGEREAAMAGGNGDR